MSQKPYKYFLVFNNKIKNKVFDKYKGFYFIS